MPSRVRDSLSTEWIATDVTITCAKDLEQLVNHGLLQFLASSSSAPELPATAASSDSQQASNGCLQVSLSLACAAARHVLSNFSPDSKGRRVVKEHRGIKSNLL